MSPDQNQQTSNENNKLWYQKTSNYYLELCIMFILLCVISVAMPIGIYGVFGNWRDSLWAGSFLVPVAFIFTPLYVRTRMEESENKEKQRNILREVLVITFSVIAIISSLILLSNSVYSFGESIINNSSERLLSVALPSFLASLMLTFLTFSVAKKPKAKSTIIFSTLLFGLMFSTGVLYTVVGIVSGTKDKKDCPYNQHYSTTAKECVYNYNNY
jgi:hypothetical protein